MVLVVKNLNQTKIIIIIITITTTTNIIIIRQNQIDFIHHHHHPHRTIMVIIIIIFIIIIVQSRRRHHLHHHHHHHHSNIDEILFGLFIDSSQISYFNRKKTNFLSSSSYLYGIITNIIFIKINSMVPVFSVFFFSSNTIVFFTFII